MYIVPPLLLDEIYTPACTDKYIQNYVKIAVLESILENTVGYVLSKIKQLRIKLDVHHYIGCFVS